MSVFDVERVVSFKRHAEEVHKCPQVRLNASFSTGGWDMVIKTLIYEKMEKNDKRLPRDYALSVTLKPFY